MRRIYFFLILPFLFLSFETYAQKGKLSATKSVDLPISCISVSPDMSVIAIADDTEYLWGGKDKEIYKIKILKSETYATKYELIGHRESIESISFSPDSKKIVSSDKAGVIIVWDLSNGNQLWKVETENWVHKAKFSSSGNEIIAIQGYEKIALVFNIKGDFIFYLPIGKQINDFDINNKTSEIIFGCYDEIQVWSIVSREKLKDIPFKGLMCMNFNHNYSQFAIGLSDGNIVLMTPELQVTSILKGHFKPVLSLSFNADDSKLASASSDQTARVWDLKKQKAIITLTNEHKGMVSAIEFISKNNEFMTGGKNKELKIWQ